MCDEEEFEPYFNREQRRKYKLKSENAPKTQADKLWEIQVIAMVKEERKK